MASVFRIDPGCWISDPVNFVRAIRTIRDIKLQYEELHHLFLGSSLKEHEIGGIYYMHGVMKKAYNYSA
jgi:hypothetical protein